MKILKHLFNSNTRNVQVINLVVSIFWFIILVIPNIQINLPKGLVTEHYYLHLLIILTIIFSILGFISKEHKRQLFKSVGLIFGSLVQAIISSYYITAYPPFEPMLLVCSIFSIWLFTAVMYINYVEGLYVKSCRSN